MADEARNAIGLKSTRDLFLEDGVYYVQVRLPNQSAPVDIALHGVSNDAEAARVCEVFEPLAVKCPTGTTANRHE